MKTEYNANELLSSQYESLAETRKQWANVLKPSNRKNVVAKRKCSMLEFLQSLFN